MATKTLDCARHQDALAIAIADPELRTRLIDQALDLISTQTAGDEAKRAVLALLVALAPRNYLEATLALQIIGTHEAAMEGFRRAAVVGQKLGVRDVELRHATKLLNLFSGLLAGYEKRRRCEGMGGAPKLSFRDLQRPGLVAL